MGNNAILFNSLFNGNILWVTALFYLIPFSMVIDSYTCTTLAGKRKI